MSETQARHCDELVAHLKLQMGNRQQIYIAELYHSLKKKRATLAAAVSAGHKRPGLEKEISQVEVNIIYQIEHPIVRDKQE